MTEAENILFAAPARPWHVVGADVYAGSTVVATCSTRAVAGLIVMAVAEFGAVAALQQELCAAEVKAEDALDDRKALLDQVADLEAELEDARKEPK